VAAISLKYFFSASPENIFSFKTSCFSVIEASWHRPVKYITDKSRIKGTLKKGLLIKGYLNAKIISTPGVLKFILSR
jgi:hypothetical protein